ncbi:uncharacterized protein LOC121249264 [Juglans microcarpa x Juglans regia]|uniref:uncharacterized protein LOC121249264 n=1 Tax=Juglans microcarpa x Juglans regia TaxID=2249226 RepID=UPI001B7E308C|nr:uncharacterized protein LOC121249264 [Juglans microcarpa x Juglans regia]
MFFIPTDSSPRPDGFGSGFYKVCWDIVQEDVMMAVHDFFRGGIIPREFTAMSLVLIPKVDNLKSFDKFIPISLCSAFYKTCTKILSLHKPARGGNVVIKIDMAKANDSIEWNFLIHVLLAFGFSGTFCNLVRQLISSPSFSVVMNGVSKDFFQGARGLRQGDLITPYLFIMVEEILSRNLKKRYQEGWIAAFSLSRNVLNISHLLYADDIIIFSNGSKALIKAISESLALYEAWSGQKISKEKSSIFFSKLIPPVRRRQILRITRFSEGSLPFKYLGVPIIFGRLKSNYFDELVGKIGAKIGDWISRLLSSGARLILGYKDEKPKRHWKGWDKLCTPSREWGIGIRNFQDEDHISLINPNKGSRFWKLMTKCIPDVIKYSQWKPKAGHISFWFDKWLGEKNLAIGSLVTMPRLKLKDVWLEDGWDVDLLYRLVGSQKAQEIVNTANGKKEGEDILIWGDYEDLNHVLANGEVAQSIWRKCAIQVGLNIELKVHRRKRMQIIQWHRLKHGWFKLNVDGSSKGNSGKAGAGGILPDAEGKMIFAFSSPLEHGTNNYAEFMALFLGVRKICLYGLDKIEIEMNSQIAVN